LIEYLGDVWDEIWDAMLFKLRAALDEHAIEPKPTSQYPIFLFPILRGLPKK
jgi:hypothetical protein